MKTGWLWSACGMRVEHIPCPRPGGSVDAAVPAAGVLHTVEGGFDSGLTVFRKSSAPHFLIGPGRIAQLIPLGAMAAALKHTSDPPTNGWARVQIEVAGYSQQKPYRFDRPTEDALARLLAALQILGVVPLVRPFPDPLPPPPWATTSFVRRRSGKWGSAEGWFGHLEIPENSHWDPGALEWTRLLLAARAIAAAQLRPHPKPKKLPRPKAIPAAVRAPRGSARTLAV